MCSVLLQVTGSPHISAPQVYHPAHKLTFNVCFYLDRLSKLYNSYYCYYSVPSRVSGAGNTESGTK